MIVDVRIVVSFVGGWGHAEPLLPIAELARGLGHQVTFAGQSGVLERLRARSFETEVVGPDTLATEARPLVPANRLGEQHVIRDHFVLRYGSSRADSLGALYDRHPPDLVVCDEVDVGCVVAAELRSIPCVTVAVLSAGLLMSPDVVAPAWELLRKSVRLQPDPSGLQVNGRLKIAAFPRSMRSPRVPVPESMRIVRPPILDQVVPLTGKWGRPLVYATLGTVFNLESGDLLVRIMHAMNALSVTSDLDVVITTGPGFDSARLPAPQPGVRVAEFVPHRELLVRCRAVVSHAGSGTLTAALSLGIPVVTLPIGADQPDNADRCRDLGVGITLDALRASPADIAGSTEEVLGNVDFRKAALQLAGEAASQPPLNGVPELRDLLLG